MTHRAWVFTLNNPLVPLNIDDWPVRYVVYQKETGASGTPHFQGYAEFTQPIRLSGVRRLLAYAHWEPRRGSRDQARAYSTKEDTRTDGPWEYGDWDQGGQGSRTDVSSLKAQIQSGCPLKSIFEAETLAFLKYSRSIQTARLLYTPKRDWPTDVTVLVGPSGVGKSRYCKEVAPDAYWKQPSNWWDGYDGQPDVVLDDFYGWLPFHELLRVLDRYEHQVQSKGGNTQLLAKRVFITSNRTPDKWYDNTKRSFYLKSLYRRLTKLIWVDEDGEHQSCESIDELILLASSLDATGPGTPSLTGLPLASNNSDMLV